eukprot:scaffold191203_cov40-Tisochrysis_lutea.AAC.2
MLLGAALAARTAEVTVRMPLELVRTRMQASRGGLTLTDCVASLRAQPISGWCVLHSPHTQYVNVLEQ